MEFFFEVDHCMVLFTIGVRPEAVNGESYSKINLAV